MRPNDYFSAVSRAYAAHRPGYPVELARWLAQLAPARELAWDAGCGSGQFSLPLAECFQHVIATDASEEQLKAARPHPKVEYRREPAEHTSLADHSVDLVASAQAAHWFGLPAFYEEARRVARPGAVLALLSYNRMVVTPQVDRVIKHFYSNVAGPFWPPERRHVDAGYQTFAFPFDEIASPPFELREHWTPAQVIAYVETWSAVSKMPVEQRRAALEAFSSELENAWGEPHEVRAVRWPLALRVGRVE